MHRAFLGLGANIGDREQNLLMALRLLAERARVVAVSSLYRSEAVVLEGTPSGPDYLNAACDVETALSPQELLAFVKEIEHTIGRRRAARWAPRPIDIDILLYDDVRIDATELVVPHPRICERNFVLVPLADIAPDVVHPVESKTIGNLAAGVGRNGLERVRGADWAAGAMTNA